MLDHAQYLGMMEDLRAQKLRFRREFYYVFASILVWNVLWEVVGRRHGRHVRIFGAVVVLIDARVACKI